MMKRKEPVRWFLAVGLTAVVWLWGGVVSSVVAEETAAPSPGILERIGNAAKKVGNKIEQGFTKAGRKLKEKKVGEKVERKLKKAAHKTAEGFKKAGEKIDKKLNN